MLATKELPKTYRIKSFVLHGRGTPAQERAYKTLWPQFGLNVADGLINFEKAFGRTAPRLLEIGFGTGQSLLAAAKANPDKDFLAVETHKPGVGALLVGIEAAELTNIRIYHHDVIDVLEQCIPMNALDSIQIFFPDPWQKRRHHARRLIQLPFLDLIADRLVEAGNLHLATDWEDYSRHMMEVVTATTRFKNVAGVGQFSERSCYRPVLSKFEKRAIRDGRHIWDLLCQK